MTHEEFQAVFSYLTRFHEDVQSQDWYLPYGFLPGARPGGQEFPATREAWLAYGWNPPQYLAHLPEFTEPDNIGSPKPDWSVLVAHIAPAMLAVLRPRALRELRFECRRRIMAVYGEGFFDDEVALALAKRAHAGSRRRARPLAGTLSRRSSNRLKSPTTKP